MAIEVYNIVIDPAMIVGVGPLLRITRNDAVAVVNREFLFQFDLYTAHYKIVITTDPLSFTGQSSDASKSEYDRLRKVWQQLYDNLLSGVAVDLGFSDTMPGV